MSDTSVSKTNRVLQILLLALKGESISACNLADRFHVSTRSLSRDISDVQNFISENQEILGYAQLEYSYQSNRYVMDAEHLFTNRELLAITKVLLASRAFQKDEMLEIIEKLKKNTTPADKAKLEKLVKKEMLHYNAINIDCENLLENIWIITDAIESKKCITISYYKMNREYVKRKIMPVSIMFSEYYFYLIAYRCEKEFSNPIYYRIDRIDQIECNYDKFKLSGAQNVDEGLLRNKSQFMWPGPSRRILFEFTGPSVQAILDRIPTARIVEKKKGKYLMEAEVYGNGIKMFLLSQGAWVKVLEPDEFAQEMKTEIEKMKNLYS